MASLKQRARNGERLLGVLIRMPAEELVEMAAVSGFDFVLLDGEHGPLDLLALRAHVALAQVHAVSVLVRVGAAERAAVLRVLDAGAEGVVAPHVDTADDAQALVDSAHYPPAGHRGFATYGRTGRFGLVAPDEHRESARNTTMVIGMIESPLGVSNAREILQVPGLDGTMVGTADLRASSGPHDLEPGAAVARVHATAAEVGALRMDIVNGAEQARQAFAGGASLVVYNLTATLMEHLAALNKAR